MLSQARIHLEQSHCERSKGLIKLETYIFSKIQYTYTIIYIYIHWSLATLTWRLFSSNRNGAFWGASRCQDRKCKVYSGECEFFTQRHTAAPNTTVRVYIEIHWVAKQWLPLLSFPARIDLLDKKRAVHSLDRFLPISFGEKWRATSILIKSAVIHDSTIGEDVPQKLDADNAVCQV